MTVLLARKVWRREALAMPARVPDLTEEERANVGRALRFLRVRAGGWAPLAKALGVSRENAVRAASPKGKPSPRIALRLAKLARVPLEDVLSGAWPPEGACAHCGRS
jgi:DNA-binding XRE family transcriptional regulator